MIKRQVLLRLRDDTETQLRALRPESFDLLDDQSHDHVASFAAHTCTGVVSLLGVRLTARALKKD